MDRILQTGSTEAARRGADGKDGGEFHAPAVVSTRRDVAAERCLATRALAVGQGCHDGIAVVRSHARDDTVRLV